MTFSLLKKKPKINSEYCLIMKEGMWDYIRRVKGWKNNQEAANNLGYTRQYISMVASRVTPATADFVVSLAVATGNATNQWYVPFEIIKMEQTKNPDNPRYNLEKFEGRIPYQPFSSSGILRQKDQKIEFREK